MEVAKLSAPPNLEVRLVSCNESAIKTWLSSELEETVFSLTHELFMTSDWSFENLIASQVKHDFLFLISIALQKYVNFSYLCFTLRSQSLAIIFFWTTCIPSVLLGGA